jgi:hypothetical protein
MKQQHVEFQTDFSIPLLKEFIISKAKSVSSDVIPTESDRMSVIPISIRLNRKGLIDSEVIAVGKMVIPVNPNLVDNLQVGLLTSEENTEIALATISVQVNMADPAVSQIFQLVTEIETLMKQYTRQDSDGTVLEVFQHYLTSSTIFREIWATWWSLLMWDSYINSLLLLVTMISHSWGLLLALAVTIFLAISREKPAPLLS